MTKQITGLLSPASLLLNPFRPTVLVETPQISVPLRWDKQDKHLHDRNKTKKKSDLMFKMFLNVS